MTSFDDSDLKDYAVEGMIAEHVYHKAKEFYKIFLFVEGDTEEEVLPEMIYEAGYDLADNSIEIANYHGIDNLLHSIKLFRKTLSFQSPVIVTFDNDSKGFKNWNKLTDENNTDFEIKPIFCYKLPSAKPEIIYSTHKGGSFEEIFELDDFIEACISLEGIPKSVIKSRVEIKKNFIRSESWLEQFKKILSKHNYKRDINKIILGLNLYKVSKEIPPDILNLIELIKKVRKEYPIKNFEDDFQYPSWY